MKMSLSTRPIQICYQNTALRKMRFEKRFFPKSTLKRYSFYSLEFQIHKNIPRILSSSQNLSNLNLLLLITNSNNRYTIRISRTYPRDQKKPIDHSETPKSQNRMLTSIECEWCMVDVVMSHHCIEGRQQLGGRCKTERCTV